MRVTYQVPVVFIDSGELTIIFLMELTIFFSNHSITYFFITSLLVIEDGLAQDVEIQIFEEETNKGRHKKLFSEGEKLFCLIPVM